jgi:hypothetical protein
MSDRDGVEMALNLFDERPSLAKTYLKTILDRASLATTTSSNSAVKEAVGFLNVIVSAAKKNGGYVSCQLAEDMASKALEALDTIK